MSLKCAVPDSGVRFRHLIATMVLLTKLHFLGHYKLLRFLSVRENDQVDN